MSIFNETPTETPVEKPITPEGTVTPSPASTTNDFADLLSVVVNDKGETKYNTVPEAIKGLAHSQAHISTLEAELATAREELAKRATIEDSVTKLTQPPEVAELPTAGLSAEDVAGLVSQHLQKVEKENAVKSNTQTVVAAVQAKFGDKAEEVFYGKAQELGMTKEQFNSLASQSPNAVLAYFNTSPVPNSTTTSSINTAGLHVPTEDVPTFMENGIERIRLSAPSKSVLMGSGSEDLKAEMERHRQAVFKKHGVTY